MAVLIGSQGKNKFGHLARGSSPQGFPILFLLCETKLFLSIEQIAGKNSAWAIIILLMTLKKRQGIFQFLKQFKMESNSKKEDFKEKEHPKEITIVVNGRNKSWDEKTITFKQVVELAFGKYEENDRTAYTVTYKNGQGNKPERSMVAGETIHVKDKMIFNVTATNRS